MPAPVAFCIGLGRTGTTTFGDAAEILGFSRLGGDKSEYVKTWGRWPKLNEAWERGDIDHIATVAERYDVLEDLPWPLVYGEMAERFPEAKFVLTRRKSPREWLKSQIAHTRSQGEYEFHRVVYGGTFADQARRAYLNTYRRHLVDVRAYFAGSDRLLEVCWEEGDGWARLCPFLGVAEPDQPFPHSNRKPPRQVRAKQRVLGKLPKSVAVKLLR